MREVGTLIWVVLVIVGVVGSMISSMRRQVQSAQSRPRQNAPIPLQWRPSPRPAQALTAPPQSAKPATPQSSSPPLSPVARRPAESPPTSFPLPQAHGRRGFFASKHAVVRGIIAAEVFGKPRAFRDEPFPY